MRIEVNNPQRFINGRNRRVLFAPTGIDFIVSNERKFNIRIEKGEVIITSNGDTFDRIKIEAVSGNTIIIK